MRRTFTVYIERDVTIECPNDRYAAQVADYLDSTVTAAIRAVNDTTAVVHSRTTMHRALQGKMLYDSDEPDLPVA